MLVNRAPLCWHAVPDGASASSSPGAPSTIRNCGRRRPRAMRSSRTIRQASVVSPPMSFDGEQHLMAVLAHPDDD